MVRALGVQLSLMLRTETVLKHSHNNHILWGEKGDVDFLCYSSGAGTHIQQQATASVKNGMKGL